MPRYIIISPVRNEAEYLPKTIECVAAQTVRPSAWLIVNDGSTDATAQVLDRASRDFDWILPVPRSDRGFRHAGTGVIDAFYDGYERIGDRPWDFLIKLDGDLSFEPDYFARCFARFTADPQLGIGGGTVCCPAGTGLRVESPVDPTFHVRGATKIYRAACWQAIEGLIRAPGWDTVDEVKANMLGWRTETFADIKLIHHRPSGAAYPQWKELTKNGLANYVVGYHPLFMLAKCFKRISDRPLLLVSIGLWVGFCRGYLRRVPQVPDRRVVRYLRQQQIRRMFLLPSIYG